MTARSRNITQVLITMGGSDRIWCGKHKLGYKGVAKNEIFGNLVSYVP